MESLLFPFMAVIYANLLYKINLIDDLKKTRYINWLFSGFYSSAEGIACEISAALSAVLLFKRYGITAECILYAFMCQILITAAILEFKNEFSARIEFMAAVTATAAFLIRLWGYGISLQESILGILVSGISLSVISLLTKGGVNIKDIILISFSGYILGLQQSLEALLTASVLSAVISLVGIVRGRYDKKSSIPFVILFYIGYLSVLCM
ncbi:MAG: hypothetical protein Q8920_00170 [Bacillota bacterium]|nr:hypothetical protein [Bacillota bacterium]